ncbi:Methyltransferase ustM [Fusarium oxysporum f. sp. albedinis]|nr:Methyltransferase ustM [Fusarium oxysporum f. sp. albedinis]
MRLVAGSSLATRRMSPFAHIGISLRKSHLLRLTIWSSLVTSLRRDKRTGVGLLDHRRRLKRYQSGGHYRASCSR